MWGKEAKRKKYGEVRGNADGSFCKLAVKRRRGVTSSALTHDSKATACVGVCVCVR